MLASVPIPLLFAITLSVLMLWVVISDTVHYIISNRLNACLIALYIPAIFLLPTEPHWALLAAGLVLVVGLGLFALGLMGGGDVKLLVVLSLWTGWGIATLQFIMLTTVFGGVLVVIVLLMRLLLPGLWLKLRPGKTLPRVLTRKQPVPYGVAVAFAFTYMLWVGMVPAVAV